MKLDLVSQNILSRTVKSYIFKHARTERKKLNIQDLKTDILLILLTLIKYVKCQKYQFLILLKNISKSYQSLNWIP